MLTAEYYRRQAETCLKLASTALVDELARHLVAMANDYKAKAQEAERSQSASSAPGDPKFGES